MLHVDGAEFYSNSEYMVWSMGSVFAEGHVWDIKFPCVCIPHALMHNVKEKVHERVADVLAWSLRAAAAGQWPSRGPFGDELSGFRGELAGTVMSGGWHACYFGYRYDAKARKETNSFTRSYQHNFVCEGCLASKIGKNCDPLLSYKKFYSDAAYRMTTIRNDLSFLCPTFEACTNEC